MSPGFVQTFISNSQVALRSYPFALHYFTFSLYVLKESARHLTPFYQSTVSVSQYLDILYDFAPRRRST